MGLLDDAIREHLELKRRHGAAAEEVARQEAEALGPPRRGEFAAPAGESTGGAPVGSDDRADVAYAPAPDEVELPPDVEPGFAGHPAPEPGLPAGAAPEPGYANRPALEPEPEGATPEPVPADPPPDPLGAGQRGTRAAGATPPPTEEWLEEDRVSSAPVPFADAPPLASGARRLDPDAPHPSPGDEDVLEETPDFLSETPDHDRLWFEQKPPRDFDFDK